MKRICLFCEKEFYPRTGNVNKGWGKYCSIKCADKAKILLAESKCEQCGEVFSGKPSEVKRKRFCSNKCKVESTRLKLPEDQLRTLYIDERKTTREIADILGTNKTTVTRNLKKYGIELRQGQSSRYKFDIEIPTREELEKLYWDEWKTYGEIAGVYGVEKSTISNWLKAHKIKRREGHQTKVGKDFVEPTKEELVELYINQKLNTTEIGVVYNCTNTIIQRRMKEHGIEARANIFGYDKLLECKDGHQVRSCYERAFDNALYRLGVEHEYEPRIPADKRYASDFKVGNVYVEIWGVQGNKKYEERKEKKRNLYKKHNLTLFEIYPEDFKNLYGKINELKRLIS